MTDSDPTKRRNAMRFFLAVTLVFVPFGFLVAQEPKPIRNVKVKQAQREYQAEQERLDRLYQEAMTTARKAYLEKLGALMKEVMVAGNLNEANAIDALRKSLDVEQPKKEAQPVEPRSDKREELRKTLENTTWRRADGFIMELLPDGRCGGRAKWGVLDENEIIILYPSGTALSLWHFDPKSGRFLSGWYPADGPTTKGIPHGTYTRIK